MHGDAALRACMLGLVLVNLVFVQLTGAAELRWLAPLYLLTVLAPLFARVREKLLYRALWNTSVVAVFAVLLRHASGYDLRYVLQDGLVLAALCQVHLLNNLRSEQRPDLLFWNSFLIAVATGYLSQDLVYPFAFLIYVPLFVIGLQLLCVTRRQRELPPGPTMRVVRDGLARSAVLLALTLAVFLFWPRDFHRPSFLAGEFDLRQPEAGLEIGFSEKLKLDRHGPAGASSRVVMTATLLRGSPADVPALWRGATLASTDGAEWWPLNDGHFATQDTGDAPWMRTRTRLTRANGGGSTALLSVEHVDPGANRLFTPLAAARVELGEGIEPVHVNAHADATLQYGSPRLARGALHYDVELWTRAPRFGGPTPAQLEFGIARYTTLPRSPLIRTAGDLADDLAARQPRGAQQHELVAAFGTYLETRYEYLAPGADGSAKSLEQFLAGSAGGHCELFASALATLLRARGVPCRVVTGYKSGEWDPATRVLTFRKRHAHAWVEVYDPMGGWYPVDPTPAAEAASGPSLWKRARASVDAVWAVVAGFDAERRTAVLAWARELPARLWQGAREHPWTALLVAAGALLAVALVRRLRQSAQDPAVRAYRRSLDSAGLTLAAGETPRDVLARARRKGVDDAHLSALAAATREHELARYAA